MVVPCKNCSGSAKPYSGKEPSPNGLGYSAKYEMVGRILKGRDGGWWQVTQNSRNINLWRPVKRYQDIVTLDNGMHPFVVRISDLNTAYIYLVDESEEEYDFQRKTWVSHAVRGPHETIEYPAEDITLVLWNPTVIDGLQKFFIPEDETSVLFKLKTGEYVYAGENIVKFSTKDEIKEYHSFVGNNAVPYAFAVGDKYTYFLQELRAMENREVSRGRLNSGDPNKKADRLGLGAFEGDGWAGHWSPYDELYKDHKAGEKIRGYIELVPRRF